MAEAHVLPVNKIDRYALVQRHNPARTASNLTSPMQVGNGRFAFGVDITGLQTFVPFSTMSEWGWKHDELPPGSSQLQSIVDPLAANNSPELKQWLISNPNRMNLGRIGLRFADTNVSESDLQGCLQRLDMWTGMIHSVVELNGVKIIVDTVAHPNMDTVGITIKSSLISERKLSIFLDFPFNDGRSKFSAPYAGYWDQDSDHTTTIEEAGFGHALLSRQVNDASYFVRVQWNQPGKLCLAEGHRFILELSEATSKLELALTFSKEVPGIVTFESIARRSSEYWSCFWESGGTIDLSRSTDPRWLELERRLVLSQYAIAVNSAGKYPPQESGLVNLGWYGKFHLEMNWWHSAHLGLFNKWPLLEPSLTIYERFLPTAIKLASSQGYDGARWPKMSDPSGRSSPGEINNLLIWQQGHPILFAELNFRAYPTDKTLNKWKTVIAATADFMVSFSKLDSETGKYSLPSPLHLMSENTNPRETYNPSFEIHYWRYALSLAETWWARLGLQPKLSWTIARQNLASLPTENGVYIMCPGIKNMWEDYNWEHPALAAMYGWLPPQDDLNLSTMLATSHKIWDTWRLDQCWGWDFGMLAMNAARSGFPEKAVDFLLDPNFVFDDLGLVQGTSQVPAPYFPGMGSLLYAVAFMAAGWDGAPEHHAPGFPSQAWNVRCEELNRAF
jgi:hypothetical protein